MDDSHEISFITVEEINMSTPKPSEDINNDTDTPVLRNRDSNRTHESKFNSKAKSHSNDNDSDDSTFIHDKGYLQSILKNNKSLWQDTTAKRARVNASPLKQVVSYSDSLETHENVFCEKPSTQQPQYSSSAYTTSTSAWFTNPSIPYTLSLYLQLACNALLCFGIIVLAYITYQGIRSDVHHRIELYTTDVMIEISHCSRDYYRNKCDPTGGGKRPPALENACDQWAKCMNRDPNQIGTAKITAEAFADIVNGFVARISWKFVIIVVAFFLGGFSFTNLAFSSYRNSLNKIDHNQVHQMHQLQQQQEAVVRNHLETENRLRTQIAQLEKERDQTPNIQSAHSLFLAQTTGNAFDMSPLLHRNR